MGVDARDERGASANRDLVEGAQFALIICVFEFLSPSEDADRLVVHGLGLLGQLLAQLGKRVDHAVRDHQILPRPATSFCCACGHKTRAPFYDCETRHLHGVTPVIFFIFFYQGEENVSPSMWNFDGLS